MQQQHSIRRKLNQFLSNLATVSYTHLDVYKRQVSVLVKTIVVGVRVAGVAVGLGESCASCPHAFNSKNSVITSNLSEQCLIVIS